ncbi:hypothetical protein QJQ45_003742 [Haematococcus lacustris]|nr:hypothetical protein QJQ45_003742 [Haematococcus lacustris]
MGYPTPGCTSTATPPDYTWCSPLSPPPNQPPLIGTVDLIVMLTVTLSQGKSQISRHLCHPVLKPIFDDPSNPELLAKLPELGSISLCGDNNITSAHSMKLAVSMKQHSSNLGNLELKATNLDKKHIDEVNAEADKHCRLLGISKQHSLREALPLPCRMRHAVHVCQCQEQWRQPPNAPTPGQSKHALAEQREFVFDPATHIGVGSDPRVTQAGSAASGVWDEKSGQLVADLVAQWKLTKGQARHARGLNNTRRNTQRWLAPIQPHLQHLAAASCVEMWWDGMK